MLDRRRWHLGVGALALGLALAGAGLRGEWPLMAGAVVCLVGMFVRRPRGILLVVAAVGVGFAVGQARVKAIDQPGSALRPGAGFRGRATLLAAPRPLPFGWSVELELVDGGARLHGRGGPNVRRPRLETGDIVEVGGELDRPRSDGEFDWAAHLRRRGIAAELELASIAPTGERRTGLSGFLDGVRGRAEEAIERAHAPPEAALLRGMVLGQDERIGPLVRDDFRDSGLGHLLAVSGQNVMLLAALALPLLAATGAGPALRTALLLALIALYVPLAGAGPSLQRAAIMAAAGLVALAAARPSSRSYALVLAAAVTLALNPRAAGEPGWQLSFAAVGGILWLAPLLRRGLRALPRPVAEGAAITLAATLATAPLAAYHFDRVPLASLPANLLALPAVPVVMWAGMLHCALGQLPGALAERGSAAVGTLAAPLAGYLGALARTCAELPGGSVLPPLRSPAALAGAYVLLAAVVALLRSWGAAGRHEGGRAGGGRAELGAAFRRIPARRRAALAAGLALVPALAVVVLLRAPAPPTILTVRFLDVGQGDATLVQHPDGSSLLFDGGPPEARTVRLLRDAGVHRLDLLVATHASRDHHGGLREVAERLPVGLLLDGGDGTRDRSFRALVAAARERGARVVRAVAPLQLRAGGLSVRVLSPPPRPAGPAPEDPNPRAVVAVVSAGGFDLLLSGDAESETLARLPLPDVEAIKVPHHGSSDPGLPALLDRLRPELAAIEVGQNSYGHPAPSTLAALRAARVRTWRTDRHGTVTLTAGVEGLHVTTER